ncbi:beta-ketoacyl synthase N-terminal-like domain-containing protein [Streptomyces sp. TS71-3]|uniref:beta-ketoacyl synthase N-terminal-like domain-containing protein n=1 Tax=Streptomyces sp. TS71-3 TaxID=2733862 RepID=UPI001B19248B|nr:beta-ketoacyl synthase N-terminal-like domain-containing protein [Streptomyces sp. TS71-3]GHJ36865.1 hypothetical protein Sm713_24740 [Streptomyces sp. TS71-3]
MTTVRTLNAPAPTAGSPPPGADLTVSGIGVVTPWGDEPKTGAAADRPVPDGWFDHRERLGRRGYKYLPTATQYFLAATRQALADAGDLRTPGDEEQRGAAVGCNSAAVALHDAMDRTVLTESAAGLSPVTAPYFSINLFGSRLATEHTLKAFNLTFTSPRVAGMEALEAGTRSVTAGRASWLLAGATEEALPEGQAGHESSERGAVALVLEPTEAVRARGGSGYGRCRARTFFVPPAAASSSGGAVRARARIEATVTRLSPDGRPHHRTIVIVDDSPVGQAVAGAFGNRAERVAAGAGSLEPMLQTAAALADLSDPVVIVTAAREGNVGVAVLSR